MPSRRSAARAIQFALIFLLAPACVVYGVALISTPAGWIVAGIAAVAVGRYGIDDGVQPAPPLPPGAGHSVPVRRSR